MKYDSEKHHRRSIRLKGYDYSSSGLYYVTICTQNRELLFGEINQNEMLLNIAGKMIEKWWKELLNKFPTITLDDYVIMPNHMHGIINIVGAALRGRPFRPKGQPHRVAPTLGDILDWFKTMTTNEYIKNVRMNNWQPFERSLWQRNYYEHIIRNEEDLNQIKEYVKNNPLCWNEDEENPKNWV